MERRRNCSICRGGKVAAINAAIRDGNPYRQIAREYGVALGTLSRHRNHLGGTTETIEPTNGLLGALDYAIEATRGCIVRGRRCAGTAGATLILKSAHELSVLIELRQHNPIVLTWGKLNHAGLAIHSIFSMRRATLHTRA
jgi:transposase-like protein